MTAEFGIMCLVLALLVATAQSIFLFSASHRLTLATLMQRASWLQALLVSLALASLVILRLESDFSIQNVADHSNLHLPVLYKIVGTWGNHEGSMLLWLWVLSIFGALILSKSSNDHPLLLTANAVQSLLAVGVTAFILYTSNPFDRIFPPPADGKALNPLLQDIGLALHPPLLYLGYVGFSIVFSLAVASLITGKSGRQWAYLAHPWILVAWSTLTIGIGLGSWWAYRELGWGGWWFWDPVENASLLPWLSGTALLHANAVLKKRGLLAQWVCVLSIVTFALSMIGTFLVRSGALTSVHSFASDPERGVFILAYIVITVGGALLLFAIRANTIQSVEAATPQSREGLIVLNNLFLITACVSVLIGTLYPLIAEWLHDAKLTVGAPYFNLTFIPLMILPIFFAGLAPYMPWKKASITEALRTAKPAILAAIAAMIIITAVVKTHLAYALLGFSLGAWLCAASITLLVKRNVKANLAVSVAHIGVAILVCGITGASLFKSEKEQWLRKGETLAIGGYSVEFSDTSSTQGNNYNAEMATLKLNYKGGFLDMLIPEYRHYLISNAKTSETAIYAHLGGDVYAVIGETTEQGTATRLYHIPMIHFIWAGFVLMALGGIIALLRKREHLDASF
ncbi:MAG: heme lyase CcmF/NrfE family subunit [Alphaproteobacteria bacterium]